MRLNKVAEINCFDCGEKRVVKYRSPSELKLAESKRCLKCGIKNEFNKRKESSGNSATNSILVFGKPISKHQFYGTWSSMISRCTREKNNRYDIYGGRGIKVCDEWMNSHNFIMWCESFGSMPKGTQIDRIDNNGNYDPSNCRLVTPKENARNRSTTKLSLEKVQEIKIMYCSGLSQGEIAEQFGVTQTTVSEVVLGKIWS